MKANPDDPVSKHTPWHSLETGEILTELQVSIDSGLSEQEVANRQKRFRLNELQERPRKTSFRILKDQLVNPLVLLLLGAAVAAFILSKTTDALAVLVIVVLNAILGVSQEHRAEKALAALKRMAAPRVRVRRDGTVREIPAEQLVPGDVILIEDGNAVPADARLIETANLRVQEAALTGEPQSVDKTPQTIRQEHVPLVERHNMVYLGTSVTYGRGTGVVVATGMQTELGRIAELVQTVKTEQSPIQKRIQQLGQGLALAVLAVVVMTFAAGLLRGEDRIELFQTAVSMAVAAVPEGLPAVVTIVLTLGAQRMLKRRALIRSLPTVETLGSVTVICSDKTGTLTENRMTVTALDLAGHTIEFEEALRNGKPAISREEESLIVDRPAHALLLAGAALCNNGTLERDDGPPAGLRATGDSTEGALLIAAAHLGMTKTRVDRLFPRLLEVPFSSERKRMSTIHRVHLATSLAPNERHVIKLFNRRYPYVVFTKGSVDSLLEVATHIWVDGEILALTEAWRVKIEASQNHLAQQGLHVLGMGFRPVETLLPIRHVVHTPFDSLPPEMRSLPRSPKDIPRAEELSTEIERDLILVGMIGIMDPPRQEVLPAVEACRRAGIRPVMITGDHPLTALQIAHVLQITNGSPHALTGQDLARMSGAELEEAVEEVSVFARLSPEHKLDIVEALQKRGHVVAVTGDGVNDAPALKTADIGVARGVAGTDVSKEAANLVILDDNFATIVTAVEEGRRVYETVRKFIRYTLGSNTGEVLVMFLAPFLGMPLPLTPLQLLWMNLVTDGLPGLALTTEQSEQDTMLRPPVHPNESFFARGLGSYVARIGLVMALIALGYGYWAWASGNPAWQTMVFSLLIFAQAGHAMAIRSDRESAFHLPLRTNPALIGAVLLTLALQISVVYLPPLQRLLGTQALTGKDLLLTLAAGSGVFWWVEVEKLYRRMQDRMKQARSGTGNGSKPPPVGRTNGHVH